MVDLAARLITPPDQGASCLDLVFEITATYFEIGILQKMDVYIFKSNGFEMQPLAL